MDYLGNKILVDSKIKKFVEGTLLGENSEYISLYLSDIDMSFWFDNYVDAQEFLNEQALERVYDKELRKGYFDYTNDHSERWRIVIKNVQRGKITEFEEVLAS